MASVDGSKTLLGASEEVNNNLCGPCNNANVEQRASHYCQDCPEYLCDHCKDHHRKLTLTKNHIIVSGSQVPAFTSTHGQPGIVIYCSCNKKEEAQYFCDDHQDITCDSCKHTKHYKCKVINIQDKGSSYTRSNIDTVISRIKTLNDDYNKLKKARNGESKSLTNSIEDCKKEIKAFRKELDNFLDDLEKSMLKMLDSQKDETQKRIDQHISSLTAILKLLETDEKLLCNAKSHDEKTLMFAADFQVSKGLQDYDDRLSDICNDVIETDVKFEKNTKIALLQTEIDSLGTLIRKSTRHMQKDMNILLDSAIISQKRVNIKVNDDGSSHRITGAVVMPAGEIVICDNFNRNIKLLDSSDILKDSLQLNAQPYHISFVDDKTVIVTLPSLKQLQYIEVFPRLTPGRVFRLDKKCWGVHVTGNKIFTSCHNDPGKGEVRIHDKDGNLQQQLGINQDGSFLFKRPSYITVSPSEKKVFVSDGAKNTVTCIIMDNIVLYQYSNNELKCTRGLYCDDGENILACGEDSNNIQMITADGKKHCDLTSSKDGLEKPLCISYRERDDTLIVGCRDANMLLLKLGK